MTERQRRHTLMIITILSLLSFWWMGLQTARLKSFTIDEPYHVVRAIAIRQGVDFWLQLEHTPLCHWLEGIFLPIEMTPPLETVDGWDERNRHDVTNAPFLNWTAPEQELIRLLARIPILLFGLFFIATMIAWARRLGGTLAGLLAAVMLAFSPNLLAHASLSTTDFTAAASFGFALFTLWLYQSDRTNQTWWLAALGLGIGIAGKMTNLMLLPVWFLVVLADGTRLSPTRKLLKLSGMYAVAFMVLWGTYRFEWAEIPILAADLPPLPAGTYLSNFITAFVHVNVGQASSYLLGELRYNDGWWYYFLVALAVKLPLTIIALVFVAGFGQVWRKTGLIWAPALLVFGIASTSNLNIGLRHILPVVPLFILFAAIGTASVLRQLGERLSPSTTRLTLLPLTGLLLFGLIVGTLRNQPNHLSYFNLAAGGPENGFRYLLDSNLDWGQDVYLAGEYLDQTEASYGAVVAHLAVEATYTLPYELLNSTQTDFSPANPTPGTYVVSMNQLNGIFTLPSEINMLNRFKGRTPDHLINGTMAAFTVSERDDGDWIAHCGSITDETVSLFGDLRQLVNQPTAELVPLTCDRSVLNVPTSGAGWLVSDHSLKTGQLDGRSVEMVFHHQALAELPEYWVYYIEIE